MPTAVEIKKALKQAGLEVYRTRGDLVYLADRVRENLLMDAGTYLRAGREGLLVGFIVRAQRNDFPNDAEDHLFVRARQVAAQAIERGYRETGAEVRKVLDPWQRRAHARHVVRGSRSRRKRPTPTPPSSRPGSPSPSRRRPRPLARREWRRGPPAVRRGACSGSGGPLSRAFPGYEGGPGQLDMADAVERALAEGWPPICEGWHRDGQDAGVPRPGHPERAQGGRVDRHRRPSRSRSSRRTFR